MRTPDRVGCGLRQSASASRRLCAVIMAPLSAPRAKITNVAEFMVHPYTRGGHLGGTGGTECTSQRAGKNRRYQRVCLNRRRVCRFAAASVFTHALRDTFYTPFTPQVPISALHLHRDGLMDVFSSSGAKMCRPTARRLGDSTKGCRLSARFLCVRLGEWAAECRPLIAPCADIRASQRQRGQRAEETGKYENTNILSLVYAIVDAGRRTRKYVAA